MCCMCHSVLAMSERPPDSYLFLVDDDDDDEDDVGSGAKGTATC